MLATRPLPSRPTFVGGGVSNLHSAIGKIDFFPHRIEELPYFWYFCNGTFYTLSTAQGRTLDAFTDNFKADWGIVKNNDGTSICVPKLFYNNRGCFVRPVNGTARQVGSIELDQLMDHSHGVSYAGRLGWHGIAGTPGGAQYGGFTGGFSDKVGIVNGNSNVTVRVSTIENLVLNVGMTPAIYLGV
jgi:hypothetical protein